MPPEAVVASLSPVLKSNNFKAQALFARVWPLAAIILGCGLTVAWTGFLAYAAVRIVIHVL
jgi:hypothetical protein